MPSPGARSDRAVQATPGFVEEPPTTKKAQSRNEFMNSFFEALGWGIHNKEGYAEAYEKVIHEGAVFSTEDTAERRREKSVSHRSPQPRFCALWLSVDLALICVD